MKELLNQIPPDDTGSNTLKRYRYQAQLAVPFCLECVRDDGVRSVIMEHFEDIVVEYKDYWQFIQVKTRNANLGPWKLTDAIDGLQSLYRAYKESSNLNAKYSLFLEGAIGVTQNELQNLVGATPEISTSLITKVANKLEITELECENFLSVVTVHPDQIDRNAITAYNIRLMGQVSGNTSAREIESLEQKLTDEILRAMSCDRLENLLYQYISQSNTIDDTEKNRIEAKQLTKKNINNIIGSLLTGEYPLLKRFHDDDSKKLTKLELKLIAGGASERIIRDAKELRANASCREYEILASGFEDEQNKIIDVQIRIEKLTNSIVEYHEDLPKPAKTIWKNVLNELTQNKADIDPNRIYKQDPYLLLGAACGLSDECRIDWGVKIA